MVSYTYYYIILSVKELYYYVRLLRYFMTTESLRCALVLQRTIYNTLGNTSFKEYGLRTFLFKTIVYVFSITIVCLALD